MFVQEHYGKTMRAEEDVVYAAKRFMEKYMNDVKGEGGDISSINIGMDNQFLGICSAALVYRCFIQFSCIVFLMYRLM